MGKSTKRTIKVVDVTPQQALNAGEFSSWLRDTRRALLTASTADVPCGSCTSCCTSSYFIHIRPEETVTLARIPKQLLFKAPGLPKGHVLMGYDEQGHCPMLVNNACSIYEHRPQTCRDYDCRVFAATGIAAGEEEKALVNERVRRWQFSYSTDEAHAAQRAIHAAVQFIRERAASFPAHTLPSNPTQLALLALKTYELFRSNGDAPDNASEARDDAATAAAVLDAQRAFEDAANDCR